MYRSPQLLGGIDLARIIVSEGTKAKLDALLKPGETFDDLFSRLTAVTTVKPQSYSPSYGKKKPEKDEDED